MIGLGTLGALLKLTAAILLWHGVDHLFSKNKNKKK